MGIVFNRTKKDLRAVNNSINDIETEEYRTRMDLLYEIAQEAGSVSAVSELLERILRIIRQTLDSSVVSLIMLTEDRGELCSHSQLVMDNDNSALLCQKELFMDSGVTGWVARNATPVFCNNIAADNRFDANIDTINNSVPKSLLATPIVRGHRVIGILAVHSNNPNCEFNEQDTLIIKGFTTTEALILLVSMAAMAIENISSIALDQALKQGYRNTAEAWASAVDNKDFYAYSHSRRVTEYTLMSASCFPFSPQKLQDIEFGALFHDIGKIGVDRSILCKPGPLTDIEWLVMHEHTRKGAEIVGEIPFLYEAKDIVLYHHERYDGTGYPENLSGRNIPIGARLVAVADAFDTMTTDHSYRSAYSIDKAISELVDGIGSQFCPVAVEAFISSYKKRQTTLLKRTSAKQIARNRKEARNLFKLRKITQPISSEVYHGDIRLIVPLTVGTTEIKRFKEHLEKQEDLKILMTGSSEKEGHLILLSLQKPMEFIRVIRGIPLTENVEKYGKDILVTLRSSYN
jgi:HD-GYP domain-containing protein (c-di-GMP phosphodiesterase class II)